MRNGLKAYGALRHFVQLLLIVLCFNAVPAHAADRLVLAFGDSLTAGYGLKPAEAFPAQLQAALRRSGVRVTVHNAGVSGDTTAQARARLNWVMRALKRKPDLVIVELGGNDMLRGIDPKQTQANLSAILATLKQQRVPVLLAGMLSPPNMGADYRRRFDALYPALARQYRTAYYPFFLKGVAGNPSLLLKDKIHPTGRGVGIIVRHISPAVTRLLR